MERRWSTGPQGFTESFDTFSTDEYVDDSVITIKVKGLLAEDGFLKPFQINVETYKGIVQLSGFVNSKMVVDKAGKIA